MVLAFVLIGLSLYMLAALLLGLRLLGSALRSRKLTDLSLALSYLTSGALGWVLFLVSQEPHVQASPVSATLASLSLLCLCAGTAFWALGTWKLFRPAVAWAQAAFWVTSALLAADFVHNGLITGVTFPSPSDPWYWPGAVARTWVFSWFSWEALRYHGLLRRRLRLGLADVVTTQQMLLWSFTGMAALVSHLVAVVATLLGVERRYGLELAIVWSCDGLVSAACILLAFFPPEGYLRWLRARADGAESAGGSPG